MLRVLRRNLGAHKLRLALSALAVILGVAFVAGTLVFTDTLRATFDDLFGQTQTDVYVKAKQAFEAQGTSGTVPDSVLATVRTVPGVAKAAGFVQVNGVSIIGSKGKPLGTPGAPNFGVSWGDDPELSPLKLEEGRGPATPDEAAIDSQSAKSGDLKIGDTVRLVTPGPVLEQKLVGIFRYGTTGNLAGASLTAFDKVTAQRLLTQPGEWTEVAALGDEGISQDELATRIRAAVGDGYTVQTADAVAAENANQLTQGLQFINIFLLVFAAIALFVGTFLILNTFSMLVAQRSKEFALLRALGASRRQVTWSLVGEAAVVGLVGGVIGLGVGLALALGLEQLFALFGAEIPSSGLQVHPRTIVVALVLGVLVTVFAALVPAVRASRVAPVAAMRDDLVIAPRSLRVRSIIGVVLLVLAALVAGLGVAAASSSAGRAASLIGAGALLGLVGLIVMAPSLAGPALSVLGAPFQRSATGRVAVGNAGRNRRRTAATASALMIGLALVTLFGVIGASTTASTDATIDQVVGADYVITSTTFQPFTPEVAKAVADVPGIAVVSALKVAPAKIDGQVTSVVGIQAGTIPKVISVTDVQGSLAAVSSGQLGVDEKTAESAGLKVGDTVEITWLTGPKTYTVGSVYDAGPLFAGYVLSTDELLRAGNKDADFEILLKADPSADPAAVRAGLDQVLAAYPTIQVRDQTEFKDQIRGQINQLLALIYALLGLAVIIAVLGIVNTLALSVAERTREIGLLRAVGASRRQVRRMVRVESLLIAVFGAVLGVVLGLIFGVLLQRALVDQGITVLAIPWTLIIVVLVLSAVVGVIAAVWPARRAAKLDVLQAITTE